MNKEIDEKEIDRRIEELKPYYEHFLSTEKPRERLEQITDPSYKEFMLSEEPIEVIAIFADAQNLDEEQSFVFLNGVSLFLLFLIDKPHLKEFLIEECSLKEHDVVLLIEAVQLALPETIRLSHEKTRLHIFGS